MVNLAILLDLRSKEYRSRYKEVLSLPLSKHSYLRVWQFHPYAGKCSHFSNLCGKSWYHAEILSLEPLEWKFSKCRLLECTADSFGVTWFSGRDHRYRNIPSQYYLPEKKFNLKLKWTYHKLLLGSSINASLYEQILWCLILARILTSLRAFSFSLSDNLIIFTFLRA